MGKRLLVAALLLGLLLVGRWRVGPNVYQTAADTTQYSPGYSERAFDEVREGMIEQKVIALLGQPIGTYAGSPGVLRWYGPLGSWVGEDSGLHTPLGAANTHAAMIQFDFSGNIAGSRGPFSGKSAADIQAALGAPIKEEITRSVVYWRYSQSSSDGSYHRRWLGFDADRKVTEKKAYFWWD